MSSNFDPRSHIGETHGIFTIVDMTGEKNNFGQYIYKSVCNECGYEKYSSYSGVSSPSNITTKCTHLGPDGQYRLFGYRWKNKRIGLIFKGMRNRCYNQNHKDYKWYGAKGINVCEEWIKNPLKFEEWSIENGYNDNLTIDRIDSDKDYSPDNCQWITLEDNTRKAGKVNWITIDGMTLTGRQWSKKLGLGLMTIDKYVRVYGIEKTKELMRTMLEDPIDNYCRKPNSTWFATYGIDV